MRATHEVLMVKSNHIFAWPFEFRVQDKTVENFAEPFEKKGWKRKAMDITKAGKNEKLDPHVFMLNQYLSASAKDIFIHEDEHICAVFEYPFRENENWEYLIETNSESECLVYRLPVVAVELHVYRHGVGILFIQAANYHYSSLDDIKKINDFGRRISIPFLPDGPNGFLLCAEKLGVVSKDFWCVTDFRKIAAECLEKAPISPEGLWQPAGFLYEILNCHIGKARTKDDIPNINPTSDDRMYMVCLIRDEALSNQAAKRNWQQPVDEKDEEFQKLLYSIIFVDPDDATCQNADMRSEFLTKAIYTRWSDWGTIYGATAFSMFCLTSEAPFIEAGVLRPFIVEYTYLLSLVLAQRIGIASYSEQAGKIVKGVDEKGTIRNKQAQNLINLQEKYITFKNQVLILEASCQEQGIDMYHLLQNQMMVQDEQEILDEQLESLYEATNVSVGNFFASKGVYLAIVAILIDVLINLVVVWLDHEGYDLLKGLFMGL